MIHITFNFHWIVDGAGFFSNHKVDVTSKTRNRLIVVLALGIPVAIFVISAIYYGLWKK